MEIDKIDKELISILYSVDGRRSYTDLGKDLEKLRHKAMSHVSVRKRIESLINRNVIKIQANININLLNYVSAFILLQTKDYDTQKRIIERFRLCPRVFSIDLITGSYNIIIHAVAPSIQELECFLNMSWIKKEPLHQMEVFISTTNVKPNYLPIKLTPSDDLIENRGACGAKCTICPQFKDGICNGCPASKFNLRGEMLK